MSWPSRHRNHAAGIGEAGRRRLLRQPEAPITGCPRLLYNLDHLSRCACASNEFHDAAAFEVSSKLNSGGSHASLAVGCASGCGVLGSPTPDARSGGRPCAAAASGGGKPCAAASGGGKPCAAAATSGGKPCAAAAASGGKPCAGPFGRRGQQIYKYRSGSHWLLYRV